MSEAGNSLAGSAEAAPRPSGFRKYLLASAVTLAVIFGALQSRQWSPSGSDDAFYLGVARNMVLGQGFIWNGDPVLISPPGWPAVLAGAMLLTHSMPLINLLLPTSCLVAALFWFCILTRYTTPRRAFIAITLTALLYEWHRYAFQFYSEGFFYFLLSAAMLLSLQIAEKRRLSWRVPLLLAICVGLILVRWAGILILPVLASILLTGQVRPKWNRGWIVAISVAAVLAASFAVTRKVMEKYSQARVDASVTAIASGTTTGPKIPVTPVTNLPAAKGAKKGLPMYFSRFGSGGEWVSRLLWPPAALGRTMWPVRMVSNTVGWILTSILVLWIIRNLKSRQWIWLGMALYCGALIFGWSRPVGRYYAPMAPLILLGLWKAIEALPELLGRLRAKVSARTSAILAAVLLASCGITNGAIWCLGVRVAQSKDFVSETLAGEYQEMLSVAGFMNDMHIRDDQVAVSVRFSDPNRGNDPSWTLRTLHFLSNRTFVVIPDKVNTQKAMAKWAAAQGSRYVLTRPPRLVTRIWHFQMPALARVWNKIFGRADQPAVATPIKLAAQPVSQPSTRAISFGPRQGPGHWAVRMTVLASIPLPRVSNPACYYGIIKPQNDTGQEDTPYYVLYEIQDGELVEVDLPQCEEGIWTVPGL